MEREGFFSGYCRQLDGPRTVTAEAEDTRLTEVDCQYENCPYGPACPIAQKIDEFLAGAESR